MRFLFLILFFVAAPALAEVTAKVQADLDGNGVVETFELLVDEENTVTLRITEEGAEIIEVPDFTWQGGLYGQEAELDLAENGSVQVISQNEGCCRHRWRQVLTLAYRGGGVRVAGITYVWRDSLDVEAYGMCDVNLLTGRAVAENGEKPAKRFRVLPFAPLVRDWSLYADLPEKCEIG